MSHNDEDEPFLMDHDYDGIKEFDNPLPTWWLITFFATIIFGFNYWIDSEFAGRKTQVQEVQEELLTIKQQQLQTKGPSANEDELKAFAVKENIQSGALVFQAKCAVCHGPEGQGVIGPNLTDAYWIHGKGTYTDLSKVISAGVADKGMPAWENQLTPEEQKQVTVFVASLIGSQPANAKPPQGEKVSP